MSEKIGIYGGTFDPIHNGHINAAKAFLKSGETDKLYIMPAFVPPHKAQASNVSAYDRFHMCELAFEDFAEYGKKIFVSDFEIKSKEKSYTVLTLRHFAESGANLSILCGTDMFLTLDEWYEAGEIFERAEIALVRREDEVLFEKQINKKISEYKKKYGARILQIEAEPYEMSSSKVRELIKNGQSTEKIIPKKVENYIKEHNLYKD